MPNIDELYPKKYISASDLEEGDWELTIKSTAVEEFQNSYTGKKEPKLVLSFAEIPQKLGLTPTNAGRIKGMFGADTDKYNGKAIIIGLEDEPKAQGGKAVRIKVPLRVVKPKVVKPHPAARPTNAQEAADVAADEGSEQEPF